MNGVEMIQHTAPAANDSTLRIEGFTAGEGIASKLNSSLNDRSCRLRRYEVRAAFLAEEFYQTFRGLEHGCEVFNLVLWTAEAYGAEPI